MTKEKLDPITLAGFTGTEAWHKFSALAPTTFLTDGAQYVAETAGAFWLMDIIGSYQAKLRKEKQDFQTWTLRLNDPGPGAVVTCEDGNDNILITQAIEFTDFPNPEIILWAIWDGEQTERILIIEFEKEHLH